MLLRDIDFAILGVLSDGKRNVPANIALEADLDRSYVTSRLPIMKSYGLVEKIGPAERSGLYRITEKGRVAYELRDEYEDDEQFAELVEEELD